MHLFNFCFEKKTHTIIFVRQSSNNQKSEIFSTKFKSSMYATQYYSTMLSGNSISWIHLNG